MELRPPDLSQEVGRALTVEIDRLREFPDFGGQDGLSLLFRALGNRASQLTGLKIHGQRAEELTCDMVGMLVVRDYVSATPSYELLPRRISRSLEHNCVDQDEGDDDHLSPRSTIRALLTLSPTLSRELVYGR